MTFRNPAFRQRTASAALMAVCLLFARHAAAENIVPACRFATLGTSAAIAVTDGRNFRLADGRDIKLLGLDVPQGSSGTVARASKAALEDLVLGKDVALTAPSDSADRYGRIAA